MIAKKKTKKKTKKKKKEFSAFSYRLTSEKGAIVYHS